MPKPTIHDLEKLLDEESGEIEIRPDGSVYVSPSEDTLKERKRCADLVRDMQEASRPGERAWTLLESAATAIEKGEHGEAKE